MLPLDTKRGKKEAGSFNKIHIFDILKCLDKVSLQGEFILN